VVFLISDFLSSGYERALRVVNKRHDLAAILITDPRELSMPEVGYVELEDAETGEQILQDTSDRSFRHSFSSMTARLAQERTRRFAAMNMDSVTIALDMTDEPYLAPLIQFFKMRAKKFR
jgi:hypothetical protein